MKQHDQGHRSISIIERVDILDVIEGRIRRDQELTIAADGWIGSLGPSGQGVAAPGEVRFDADGLYALPGLIDTHVHLFRRGGSDPRGEYLESSDGERMQVAVDNAKAALTKGVTSVRDLGSPAEPMRQLASQIASGTTMGPSIVWTGASITRVQGDDHYFGGEAESPEQAVAIIDRQTALGAGCVTLVVTGGGLTPGTNPSAVELPPDIMRAAVEAARRHGVQVVARCHATAGIRMALEMGVDTIEHASFLQDGVTVFDEDLALAIKQAGISVGPTVFGSRQAASRYRQTGPANPADRGAVARLEARLDNARRWAELGVRFAAGSSAGSIDVPPWGIVEETIAYVDLGISPDRALRYSTADAADVIGAEAGIVCPGERADLILVDSNPLEDVTVLRQPVAVIKHGQLVAGDVRDRLTE